jgi:cytoskeletal protein RodZ
MGQGRLTGRHTASPEFQHRQPAKPKSFDDYDLRLGDIMRGERATMGKSLLDVQRELKIKATYIAAIENADPSAFETPGFVAGYVRSYARYLNLDPDWAFKTFCEEGNFDNPAGIGTGPKSTPRAGEPRTSTIRDPFVEPTVAFLPKSEARLSRLEPAALGSLAVLVALIGAIGYGGWSVLQEVQRVQLTPVEQVPGVLAELDPIQGPAPSTEVALADDSVATMPAPSVEAFDRLYRPQALEVPVLVPRDGPIASLDPETVGLLAEDARAEAIAASRVTPATPSATDLAVSQALGIIGPVAPGMAPASGVQVVEAPPEVALLAVQPSWVRVQSADGTVIFEKILDAGETFVLPPSDEPHRLRAGNAGSLYFSVNGETYGPAGEGPSVVRDVALSVDAVKEVYALADPAANADLARFIAMAEAQPAPDAAPVPEAPVTE